MTPLPAVEGFSTSGQARIVCWQSNRLVHAPLTGLGAIGDIADLAVTDGNFIVGDGTTWVAESGNTARTSLGLGTGNSPSFTALTLSNGQLVFPATQVASAGANTLDDYEEGTFTPRIDGTTAAGTGTYTTQTGQYTKIGNVVYFTITLNWTAHTGTGNMVIEGLPFTSSANHFVPVTLDVSTLTWPDRLQALVSTSSTQILLRTVASGGTVASLAMDTAAIIRASGHYFV